MRPSRRMTSLTVSARSAGNAARRAVFNSIGLARSDTRNR
jgi:hypothetical protein